MTAQLATRTMKARRAGTCAECRGPIRVGDRIALVAGRWISVECAPAVRAARFNGTGAAPRQRHQAEIFAPC